MKQKSQKSIANFFGKRPASAVDPAPKTTTGDGAVSPSDSKVPKLHPKSSDAERTGARSGTSAHVPLDQKASIAVPAELASGPAPKKLRRLKQIAADDKVEQTGRLSLEDNVEDAMEDVSDANAAAAAAEGSKDGPALKKQKVADKEPTAAPAPSPSRSKAAPDLSNSEAVVDPSKFKAAAESSKSAGGLVLTSGVGGQNAGGKNSEDDVSDDTAAGNGDGEAKESDKEQVVSAKANKDKTSAKGKASGSGKGSGSKAKPRGKAEAKPPAKKNSAMGLVAKPPPTATAAVAEGQAEGEGDVKGVTGEEDSDGTDKQVPKAAPLMKLSGGKGKATSKVDGVGAGAIEAAARHKAFDLQALATWPAGKPVPYSFLVDTFEAIASTTKRLLITEMLINAFRAVIATTPADLLPTVYLCSDRVAPAHSGIELGVGESILVKALAQVTGRKDALLKKQYEECGDLGLVAVQNKSTQSTMFKPAPLTIAGVFKTFKEISMTSGQSSQDKKKGLITKLLVASQGSEAGYIMRSLQGKLRIGLAEQTVLVALARAIRLQKEQATNSKGDLADQLEHAAQIVKAAYSECPSYDKLVPALLEHGIDALPEHCHFMPGVPVRPMLAKATNGVSEVLDKFQDCEFTCEYKYDGERAQIHVLEDGKVQIYSRNAEDTTSKYTDVAKRMKSLLKPHVKSIVIDSEVVAWDREAKRILPFQILSTRARKDVNEKDIKVQVCSYAFDCLYLNGRALLKEPLTTRREVLYSALEEQDGLMQFALAKVSRDVEELALFLNESVEAGTEGLIVKTLADTYEPSKRSSHWLKLKKDYLDGVGDTFDVVPIGAWHGKGKRTGSFGAYLLAIYDPDSETFQTISKLGTGFSEEEVKELADNLRPHVIDKPKSYYVWGETLEPDVWFNPVTVWEVKAADLSISPVHKASMGLVDPSKGISIRFPRLLRVREDKKPEEATSPEQVAEMYRMQAVVNSQKRKQIEDEEEG